MCLYRGTNISSCCVVALLAMNMIVARSAFAFSGEPPVAAAKPAQTAKADGERAKAAIKDPKQDVRTRPENTRDSSGGWNRTPVRPARTWTMSASRSDTQSKIRFFSASGTEEGTVSAAAEKTALDNPAGSEEESTPVAGNENLPIDATTLVPTMSLSVKEQLLNALRAQRDASESTMRQRTPAGALAIMHTPKVTIRQPAVPAENHRNTTSRIPTLTTDDSEAGKTAATDSEVLPKSQKSYVGLTRTFEEDPKSNNPHDRERAQRYLRLRLQMQ